MYRSSIFLMPLLLVGCYAPNANAPQPTAAAGSVAEASLEPADMPDPAYRAPVAAYIKRYFLHADSLREVKIGTPFAGKLHGRAGSIVCVEMDAKNTAGAYTGLKRTGFLVKDQKVIESDYDTPACRSQKLVAWPEMEAASPSRAIRKDKDNVQSSAARKQQGMK